MRANVHEGNPPRPTSLGWTARRTLLAALPTPELDRTAASSLEGRAGGRSTGQRYGKPTGARGANGRRIPANSFSRRSRCQLCVELVRFPRRPARRRWERMEGSESARGEQIFPLASIALAILYNYMRVRPVVRYPCGIADWGSEIPVK